MRPRIWMATLSPSDLLLIGSPETNVFDVQANHLESNGHTSAPREHRAYSVGSRSALSIRFRSCACISHQVRAASVATCLIGCILVYGGEQVLHQRKHTMHTEVEITRMHKKASAAPVHTHSMCTTHPQAPNTLLVSQTPHKTSSSRRFWKELKYSDTVLRCCGVYSCCLAVQALNSLCRARAESMNSNSKTEKNIYLKTAPDQLLVHMKRLVQEIPDRKRSGINMPKTEQNNFQSALQELGKKPGGGDANERAWTEDCSPPAHEETRQQHSRICRAGGRTGTKGAISDSCATRLGL